MAGRIVGGEAGDERRESEVDDARERDISVQCDSWDLSFFQRKVTEWL